MFNLAVTFLLLLLLFSFLPCLFGATAFILFVYLCFIHTYRESIAASCTVAPLASINGKFVANIVESFLGSFRLKILVIVKLVYAELPDVLLLSTGTSTGLRRDDSDMVFIITRFVSAVDDGAVDAVDDDDVVVVD